MGCFLFLFFSCGVGVGGGGVVRTGDGCCFLGGVGWVRAVVLGEWGGRGRGRSSVGWSVLWEG